jgi:hypothetical protein
MMHRMMGDGSMGAMRWAIGLLGVVLLAIGILAVAALVKYVFLR